MKMYRRFKVVALVVTLAGSSWLATAQPADNDPNRPPRERGGPAPMQRWDFPVMRTLTDEQRTSMRKSMEAQREKAQSLQEKLRDARRDVIVAAAEKDTKQVRTLAEKIGKLETELIMLRAEALSKVEPRFTREQIEQIKAMPTDVPNMNRGEGNGPMRERARNRRDGGNTNSSDSTK